MSQAMDLTILAIALPGATEVAPFLAITSMATCLVLAMVASISAGLRRLVSGTPPTEVNLGSGSMFSPCSPMTRAMMEERETPSLADRTCLKRERSRIPPMPTTRFFGNPVALSTTRFMTSIGLVTVMIMESGAFFATSFATELIIPAFLPSRSIRVMPGFLANPAVITTTLAPFNVE